MPREIIVTIEKMINQEWSEFNLAKPGSFWQIFIFEKLN